MELVLQMEIVLLILLKKEFVQLMVHHVFWELPVHLIQLKQHAQLDPMVFHVSIVSLLAQQQETNHADLKIVLIYWEHQMINVSDNLALNNVSQMVKHVSVKEHVHHIRIKSHALLEDQTIQDVSSLLPQQQLIH